MPSRISNLAGFTTSLSSTTDLSVGVITATSLSVGDIQISSGIISAVSGVITYFGDASSLTGISAGSSITDDTSTDSSFYPLFTDSTSGILTSANVSSTKLTFNPSSATLNVGSGVTITGDGDISIAGTIYASSLNVPIQLISFDPAIGSTSVGVSSNIILTFNQTVGLGTTGFFDIHTGLNTDGGTLSQRFNVGDSQISVRNAGTDLTVNPTSDLSYVTSYHVTMTDGFITANGSKFVGINTVGTAQTYYFTTKQLSLGDPFGGGLLICQSGGIRWVAANSSSEVSRSWYCREDANIVAQANTGCTGWFIPSCDQLKNPGATCKIYWTPTGGCFWSNTQSPSSPVGWAAWAINPSSCTYTERNKVHQYSVRSFRCVSY